MARRSLPIPPPLEGNDQLITAVLTGGWVIALIVVLLVHAHLAPANRWWTWVTVAGIGIGLFGLAFVPWLKRSRRRSAQQHAARRADSGSKASSGS
jgi:Protein of unknown function (DUF2530)